MATDFKTDMTEAEIIALETALAQAISADKPVELTARQAMIAFSMMNHAAAWSKIVADIGMGPPLAPALFHLLDGFYDAMLPGWRNILGHANAPGTAAVN